MPLPRWLHSLFPHKSQQTSAPPPPRGEGWGGGPRPTTTAEIQPPPSPDNSHRLHIAANDPAFPGKREAAVALICAAITDIATPMGYTRKGTTWARESTRGKAAIHLQRSRYGFTADIILRFLTPDGKAPTCGVWAQGGDLCIALFCLPTDSSGLDDGVITYLDVHDNPACLDAPMRILASRALPWLDAHLTTDKHPQIEDFLPR